MKTRDLSGTVFERYFQFPVHIKFFYATKKRLKKMRKKIKIHAFSLVFIFHFGENFFM